MASLAVFSSYADLTFYLAFLKNGSGDLIYDCGISHVEKFESRERKGGINYDTKSFLEYFFLIMKLKMVMMT